jgi:hypothetical protein
MILVDHSGSRILIRNTGSYCIFFLRKFFLKFPFIKLDVFFSGRVQLDLWVPYKARKHGSHNGPIFKFHNDPDFTSNRPWTTSYKNFVVRFHISRHHFYILGLFSDRWSHNWPIIKCHNDHYFMSMDYQLKKFLGEHLHFQAPFLYPRTIQRSASSGFKKVMLKPQSTGNKI